MGLFDTTTVPARPTPPLTEVDTLVELIVQKVLAEIRATLPDPTITVYPSAVSVAAPQVTVGAPDVDVPPVDLSALADVMAPIAARLATIEDLLRTPTTRTVERGPDGLITKITETRA
jgi:hypothetical protein